MSDCMINPHSSRVCVLGTKSCVMKHTGIVERDKRIAELEEALEKSLTDCQDCMAEQDQQIAELEAEIERLRKTGQHCGCVSSEDGESIVESCMFHANQLAEIERLRSFIKRQMIVGSQPGSWTRITDKQIDNAVYDIARENK